MRSCLITFEGGEGAGKSSLIISLHAALIERGLDVLQTKEPGGTESGEVIRELLLHPHQPIVAKSEVFLYLADRAQHVEKVIRPALNEGKVILCDRYNDSTIAYQGGGRGFGMEKMEDLCSFATGDLTPSLTLYLDIDPLIGLKRVKQAFGHKDRIEAEEIAFHKKVRSSFLKIAQKYPKRFQIIDGSLPRETVFEKALELVDAHCFASNG